MQTSGVREGFVKIHRKGKGLFNFTGLKVLGRSRTPGLHYGDREVVPAHNAPKWFLEFCEEFGDTRMQLRVKVIKLVGGFTAEVMPLASSREEAMKEYTDRYGSKPEAGGEAYGLPESAYEHAFKAHRMKAMEEGFQIVSEVTDGLMSYTIVRKDMGPRRCIIRGGMLINKVVPEFKPHDDKWRQAYRSFVRIQDHDRADK